MIHEYITLGDFRSKAEAEQVKKNHKKRLAYVIKENKLKVSSASFKFEISKEKAPLWFGNSPLSYPYNLSVKIPDDKYAWIFLR